MRSPHWTPVFAGHSIRSKADHHQAISRGLGRHIDEAVPVNQTPAFEFMISEGDNGAKGVVLLRANGSLEETKAELTGLAQSHPGTPVILILNTNRPEIEEFLSLPVADFHDAQSGEALLQKRVANLSKQPTQTQSPPLPALIVEEEMKLWRSIFEKAGAGMLTGKAMDITRPKSTVSERPLTQDELGQLTLGDTVLKEIQWELNNKEATALLNLKEPVLLSNSFLTKLKPSNPQIFLEALEQLGRTLDVIHHDVSYTTDDGTRCHLSMGISITSEKDNLVLVTILDITPRKRLEKQLRDNLRLLEERVTSRTKDIAVSNQQLAHESTQRKRLTGQLRESFALLTQSMIGAKHIMEVALPSKEELNSIFPNSILINRPRDIMGGDFLFTGVKQGKKTLALIDSTGHGIPGAMVSLMGSSLINKAFTVLETSNPSDILTHFQKEFDLRMQVNQGTPQMYGFDAAILTVDAQTKTIEFAGARGDLFLVRDGVTHTFRGSRASIDLMPRDARKTTKTPYERHVIDYLPGDQFYMISDGIRDQFGGERNRKMGRKRLCDILAKNSALKTVDREKAIQKDLLIWKGANAKVDDATLVGIQC